jgi:hypothetical protein
VMPAGRHSSYSNHGTALAAHIVELVSGMKWDEYVEYNIINALELSSTTFRQPLPDNISKRVSKAYKHVGGRMVEKPFELIPLAPVGSVTTSAPDMARFMKMLLAKGQLNDSTILDSASFNMLLKPFLQHADGVNKTLQGFMDVSRNGVRIVGHGGDTFWFHSLLALLPDHDMGIFLSFNSEGGGGTYLEVLDAIVDEFFAESKQLLPTIELEEEYIKQFAGEYIANRYPHSDYLKLVSLFSRMEVLVEDGKLKVLRDDKASYWEPVGTLLFQKQNEPEYLAFALDDKGKVAHAFDGRMAIFAYNRANVWETKGLHFSIFLGAIILSVIVIIYWPLVFFVRRRYHPMSVAQRTLPVTANVIAWICALLLLSFYFGLSAMLSDVEASVYSVPVGMKFLLIIPFVILIISLAMAYLSWEVWFYRGTRLRSRFFYSLITVVNLFALWQIYFWNFLGWNY